MFVPVCHLSLSLASLGLYALATPTTSVCHFLRLHPFPLLFQSILQCPAIIQVYDLKHLNFRNWTGFSKVLIFICTIHLGFCVALYLWFLSEPSQHEKCIWLYNSLNWPAYNNKTQALLYNKTNSQVVIAMDTLSVGVDIPSFSTVILFRDLPADMHELVP
jgi:hypothetical protein